jgi:HK97 family phage major capsid protein
MSKYIIELPNHPVVLALRNDGVTIEDLREQVGDLNEQAQTIQGLADSERRALTAAESKELDRIMAQFDSTVADIERRERTQGMQAWCRTPQPRASDGGQLGQYPHAGMRGGNQGQQDRVTVQLEDGRTLPMLNSAERFADHHRRPANDRFSLADWVRGNMGAGPMQNTASSSATVPVWLGSQIIDSVRAQTRVVQAGCGSIMVDGPTVLAKITTNPTVYQHTEGANDISTSDLVLSPVTLNPQLLVCEIPLTIELVEDSPNLDLALKMALSGTFAAKTDSLCMTKLLADASILDSAAGESCATWAGTLAAIGSALAANQGLPKALICNPSDYIARHGLLAENKAGSENVGGWLGTPELLKGMADLFSTGCTAGHAIFGDWARAFALAIRHDLRLEIVRWNDPSRASHLLIAHMRVDGFILQSGHLYHQKTTV